MKVNKIIGIIILFIFCCLGLIAAFNYNDHDYVITITDKERIYEESKENLSTRYLVFGDFESGESLVFENTDTFLRLKWNSSNFQGKLKVGHTYKITVIGYRIPFFSMYENIIKIEELKE